MTFNTSNNYRDGRSLTPEGALEGLADLVAECQAITKCEADTRPFAPTFLTTDETVDLALEAKTRFANVEAINRAICAHPFPDSHDALVQLTNIVPALYAFAKAETAMVRERAQIALMDRVGL